MASSSSNQPDEFEEIFYELSVHETGQETNQYCSISPLSGSALPSLSPATCNWLQSTLISIPTTTSPEPMPPPPVAPLSSTSVSTSPLEVVHHHHPPGPEMTHESSPGEAIDWKALNEFQIQNPGLHSKFGGDKSNSSSGKEWKVIPQYGVHGYSSYRKKEAPMTPSCGSGVEIKPSELSSRTTMEEKAVKLQPRSCGGCAPDPLAKRKAMKSPEFTQYSNYSSNMAQIYHKIWGSSTIGSSGGGTPGFQPPPLKHPMANGNPGNEVGKRPAKRTMGSSSMMNRDPGAHPCPNPLPESSPTRRRKIHCKCSGKCRNSRCACVKAGLLCDEALCKCESCRNPFQPVRDFNLSLSILHQDDCFMHNLSKIKDMKARLTESLKTECCGLLVQVKDTIIHGYVCPKCHVKYTYSFCWNRLCNDTRRPRRHCSTCKRCGDYRNQHCFACGHCYFAGVANSFSCTCKKMEVAGGPVDRNKNTHSTADQSPTIQPQETTKSSSLASGLKLSGTKGEEETIKAEPGSKIRDSIEDSSRCPVQ